MSSALRLLAAFLGLAVLAVEARHSYTGPRSLVANLDDYAVGLLLLTAAAWNPTRGASAIRAGAFGFLCGMLYKTFLRRLESLAGQGLDPLTCAVGSGLLLGLIGLGASLREARAAHAPLAR